MADPAVTTASQPQATNAATPGVRATAASLEPSLPANEFVAALSSPWYVGSSTNADPEVAAAKLLSLPASGSVRPRCQTCGEEHRSGREAIECDHNHGRHDGRPARGCNWCGTLQ